MVVIMVRSTHLKDKQLESLLQQQLLNTIYMSDIITNQLVTAICIVDQKQQIFVSRSRLEQYINVLTSKLVVSIPPYMNMPLEWRQACVNFCISG